MAEEKSKVKSEKLKVQVKSKKAVPDVAKVKPTVKAKPEAKTEAKKADISIAKPAVKARSVTKSSVSLTLDVLGLDGKASGKIALPEEIFGEKVNKTLLAQAVRVYLANQRQGNASTKTRGEVEGSTRKIYRQKGTGRARHGGIRAPIFVKGGIVFGPKPRDFGLSLPKKMKRKALFSALSAKVASSQVTVLAGLEDMKPKTKLFVDMLSQVGMTDKKQNALFVSPTNSLNARRAGQNVQGIAFTAVNQLHAYAVLKAKNVVLSKEAIEEMKKQFLGKDK